MIAIARTFALLAAASALAQSPATPAPYTLVPLSHGVTVAIDNPAAKSARAGSNASFLIGPSAVAVVDTFESPAAAQQLLDDLHKQTQLPVRFVINTHYHIDHVAGNQIFATAGATVFAHENVRTWERTENLKFFGPAITPAQRTFVETLGLPDVTYTHPITLSLGGSRTLLLRPMPGHTGGDTIVYDRESNTVFCGDLFWNHTLPNLIDASTGLWIASLDTLLAEYPTATFVPGHGDTAGTSADVRAFRDYLAFLRAAIVKAQSQPTGKTGKDVVSQVLPQLKARYGTWSFFDFAEPDILRTDEELHGTKKLPQPTLP